MAKIVSVDQMRAIEQAADASGLTYARMMENAGQAVAEAILKRIPSIVDKHVLVLAGSGNNGGDGLVAVDILAESGASISVYLTKERGEEDPHLVKLRERGVLIAVADQDQRWRVLNLQLGKADIVLDAVLGTGFQLPLQGTAKDVLGAAKRALAARPTMPLVVAVDCPSGLDCDIGQVAAETLPADLTVTLAAAKLGLLRFPGAGYVGKLQIGDIGLPAEQEELSAVALEMAEPEMVRDWLPVRPRDAHKGTFGRALIVAGSNLYPGAAALAARSAYLVGAGLVSLAVPASIQPMLVPSLAEATWLPLPEENGRLAAEGAAEVLQELAKTQSMLLGPGFGLGSATKVFLERIIQHALSPDSADPPPGFPPCVVDADGLKLLAEIDGWQEALARDSVLTPHPGEMSRMTGSTVAEIQSDRVASALKWAGAWGHIVVLKGAFTVVASPTGKASVIPIASPALARAGTGDVLAGVIVGLMAQGASSYEAAVLGAYLHGRAGILAEERVGTAASVLAGDVAAALPLALRELRGNA